MTRYEIRAKDLKTVVATMSDRCEHEEALCVFRLHLSRAKSQFVGKPDSWLPPAVLVLHTFETDAEADKLRLDWLEEHWFDLDAQFGGETTLREYVDQERKAPQPSIKVIATPEGLA